jgi:hypothetical protein
MQLAQQVKELMVFNKAYITLVGSDIMFKTGTWFNPFSVMVNCKQYELKPINFYNQDGIVYKVNSGWFGNNNEWGNIELSDNIVYRKKEKFDGKPFILPRKKEWRNDGLQAEIYLPMAYLESIGYEETIEEKTARADHYKYYYIETPYFKQHIKTEHNEDEAIAQKLFNDLKMEMMMAIDKAQTREELSKAYKSFQYDV